MISFREDLKFWRARIMWGSTPIHLGNFVTKELAEETYDYFKKERDNYYFKEEMI